jgi:hypothetical protein
MQVDQTTPRYEFRTFGQHFEKQIEKMKAFSAAVPEKFRERWSEEIYLISTLNSTNNIKIRDEKLDIKTLINQKDGLEQWDPSAKERFPLSVDFLANVLFPAFEVPIPDLDQDSYDLKTLLRNIRIHPDLMAVQVRKQRFGFLVNGTICEYAYVLINGARVVTLSTESEDAEMVLKTMKDLDLHGLENINYLQAIMRVTGLVDLPLMNLE